MNIRPPTKLFRKRRIGPQVKRNPLRLKRLIEGEDVAYDDAQVRLRPKLTVQPQIQKRPGTVPRFVPNPRQNRSASREFKDPLAIILRAGSRDLKELRPFDLGLRIVDAPPIIELS